MITLLQEIRDLHKEDVELRRVMLEEQRAQFVTLQADTQRSLRKQQRSTWIMLGLLFVLLFAWPLVSSILYWFMGTVTRGWR